MVIHMLLGLGQPRFLGPPIALGMVKYIYTASGEVRLALLSLLEDGPKHGYQLMKDLEAKSGGLYRASAGATYPTLQQLEDEGLVTSEQAEGRRAYQPHRCWSETNSSSPPTRLRISGIVRSHGAIGRRRWSRWRNGCRTRRRRDEGGDASQPAGAQRQRPPEDLSNPRDSKASQKKKSKISANKPATQCLRVGSAGGAIVASPARSEAECRPLTLP